MNMNVGIIAKLIYVVTCCFAEEMYFKLEKKFNNQIRFVSFQLGPPQNNVFGLKCASLCLTNPDCALHRINRGEKTCQLFSDARTTGSEGELQGAEYFSSARWIWPRCTVSIGYTYLSTSKMCVKISPVKRNYTDALVDCQSEGGRTVVMEGEDKANDVRKWLTNIGRIGEKMYVGAIQAQGKPNNTFIWEDGRPVTRGWRPGEPDKGDESCVITVQNALLADVYCRRKELYICELVFW